MSRSKKVNTVLWKVILEGMGKERGFMVMVELKRLDIRSGK